MEELAVEDLVIFTILGFCEHSKELGCPENKPIDKWFSGLSYDEAYDVARKLIDIQEKQYKKDTINEE
jgi:hypothetical protein